MLDQLINFHWNQIIFAHPWMFVLFIFPIIYLLTSIYYKKTQSSLTFSNVETLKKNKTWRIKLKETYKWLRFLTLTMLVVALAQPQIQNAHSTINTDGIDIMLSVDVSWSMMAEDFEPNRLDASKKISAEFIDKRVGDRIGLVEFSGESFSLSPVTIDHKMIMNQLNALNAGKLKDGTAIGMGLATAVDRLKNSEAKSKIIILLTDGVNNTGLIDPMTALEIAKAYNIKIYTIGVGTQGQAIMPIPQEDGTVRKEKVKVEIDEPLMQTLASETGGKYFRATGNKSLEKIYNDIDQLEKSSIKVNSLVNVQDQFIPFVLLAFLFLGLEMLLKYVVIKTLP